MSTTAETNIGGYKILGLLGTGGMGAVYMAEHELLGRKAAVKVLLAEFSSDAEVVNRFFKEAKASAAIKHPGIVKIYDFGYQGDGSAFIAMELLDGEGLDARLERIGPLPIATALRFAGHVASALAAAHAHGIVHRDLKPPNVFIVADPQVPGGERVKLLDFGIAKFISSDDPGAKQTRAGAILGSPLYMAPEQCRGDQSIDHRADLYAVGCMLFQMLCGQPPFDGGGNGPLAVMAAHLEQPPPLPSSIRPELPPEIDALIYYLMAKDPAQRYQSADDLVGAISALLGEQVSFTATITTTGMTTAPAGTDIGAVPLSPTGAPLTRSQVTRQLMSGAGTGAGSMSLGQKTETAGRRRTSSKLVAGVALIAVAAVGVAVFAAVRMGSRGASGQAVAVVDAVPDAGPAVIPEPAMDEPARVQKPTFSVLAFDDEAIARADTGETTELQVDFSGLKELWANFDTSDISLSSLISGNLLANIARTLDIVLSTPPLPPRKVAWRFDTSMPGAEVIIDGVPVEGKTTPFVVEFNETPGYVATIKVRKAGFEEQTYTLSGTEDFNQIIGLEPKIVITVRSRPEGAQILDAAGTVLGATSGAVEFSRGTEPVVLTLRLEGYEDMGIEVVPDRKKSTDRHQLTKIRATLVHHIESEPAGAEVRRNDDELGTTPLDIEFLEAKGRVSYTVALEGYVVQHVRLAADRSESKVVKLRKCDEAQKRRRGGSGLINTGPSLDDIAVLDPC